MPSAASIAVASSSRTAARGWAPSSPEPIAATDSGSTSVTVSRAVGCSLQQLGGQSAVTGTELEDSGIGDVGHFLEREVRELLVVAEPFAGALQRRHHAALDGRVDVIAVEVLQPVGLQGLVQARCVRAAAGHAGDVTAGSGRVFHEGSRPLGQPEERCGATGDGEDLGHLWPFGRHLCPVAVDERPGIRPVFEVVVVELARDDVLTDGVRHLVRRGARDEDAAHLGGVALGLGVDAGSIGVGTRTGIGIGVGDRAQHYGSSSECDDEGCDLAAASDHIVVDQRHLSVEDARPRAL